MGTCKVCNSSSYYISKHLGICIHCIREKPALALPLALHSHKESRLSYGLPPIPPKADEGIECKICANECKIKVGEYGYCGLRHNEDGRLITLPYNHGKLSWYLDPLPTNCVADWVCSAGTGSGYPEFAYKTGPEYGYYNLAVFFHACSFNCLYCQNWHFKEETLKLKTKTVDELLTSITPAVSCICYFGGDPSPQIIFALEASRRAVKEKKGRILRVCWETNGSVNKAYLDRMIDLSLSSGGCIKIDLKAWDEALHILLTGVSNKRILENFAYVARFFEKRPNPPLLVASTLLVPGYVDKEEVSSIAKFIVSLNPRIPYRLLAFYPHFYMNDIPLTPKELAYECYETVLKAGLKNVSIGNVHLLR